jgi:hypothetical protein
LILPVLAAICALAGSASAAPKLYYLAVAPRDVAMEDEFQRRLVLEQRFLNEYRLDTIRFNLGRGALQFCESGKNTDFGLRIANGSIFAQAERRLAEEGFGFDNRVRVQHVIAGSSAQQAGLHSGDAIARINGAPVAVGPDGLRAYGSATSSATRVTLSIERGEAQDRKTFDVQLEATQICTFDVQLTDSESISALTTGRHITVSKGMMWFANDAQLAFILAHEFAHVIGDHSRMVQTGVPPQEVERSADYLGMYIMARAGYDVSEGPAFFRRVAANFPQMIAATPSHPATPYRYVALTRTVDEIKAKATSGIALLPGGSASSAQQASAR